MSHRMIQASQTKFTVRSPKYVPKGTEYVLGDAVVIVNYSYYSVLSNSYFVNVSIKRS